MENEIEFAMKNIVNQVRKGLNGMELKSPIKLELTTQAEKNSKGGLDFKVVKIGGNSDSTNVQKITIEFGEIDEEFEKQLRGE